MDQKLPPKHYCVVAATRSHQTGKVLLYTGLSPRPFEMDCHYDVFDKDLASAITEASEYLNVPRDDIEPAIQRFRDEML
jgi:hypothetical protein